MTSLRRGSKLGLMNKFLAILVLNLVFCNISNAGSIKDYEKGGLKLGGSLLDLMYEDEIKENFYPITHGDKFTSEWSLQFFDGESADFVTATIYDWKYETTDFGEMEWTIGGFSMEAVFEVYEALGI